MDTKNKGGRPLLFKTPEELQIEIDKYFLHCDTRKKQVIAKNGDVIEVLDPEPYTMSGLALYMGIDRDTLLNYSNRAKFFPTIKKARDKVHFDMERRLHEGNSVGAIFSLKNNFGWKDKSEVDSNVNINKVTVEVLDYEDTDK